MVYFSVDPQGLLDLSNLLNMVHDEMNNIGQFSGDYTEDQLGGHDVWKALQDFHDQWSNGFNEIETIMSDLIQILRGAAESYKGTDDKIGQAASPQGSGG